MSCSGSGWQQSKPLRKPLAQKPLVALDFVQNRITPQKTPGGAKVTPATTTKQSGLAAFGFVGNDENAIAQGVRGREIVLPTPPRTTLKRKRTPIITVQASRESTPEEEVLGGSPPLPSQRLCQGTVLLRRRSVVEDSERERSDEILVGSSPVVAVREQERKKLLVTLRYRKRVCVAVVPTSVRSLEAEAGEVENIEVPSSMPWERDVLDWWSEDDETGKAVRSEEQDQKHDSVEEVPSSDVEDPADEVSDMEVDDDDDDQSLDLAPVPAPAAQSVPQSPVDSPTTSENFRLPETLLETCMPPGWQGMDLTLRSSPIQAGYTVPQMPADTMDETVDVESAPEEQNAGEAERETHLRELVYVEDTQAPDVDDEDLGPPSTPPIVDTDAASEMPPPALPTPKRGFVEETQMPWDTQEEADLGLSQPASPNKSQRTPERTQSPHSPTKPHSTPPSPSPPFTRSRLPLVDPEQNTLGTLHLPSSMLNSFMPPPMGSQCWASSGQSVKSVGNPEESQLPEDWLLDDEL
ncbi:hypothetical protein SAICODRAFT_217223 [Saitoella complicata NRRL Y-17804]|uniref:Uncharacterized protein n=1 Tax=Saitoella complicata (strain BCRC 22490 / CBS 7301 / JCM 7358 / NBRC 10748 / NRRL Y-17804) TaxID=698492 RepID=A0A0E9NAZ8_SAICN|nr:uncharacterized protein SAICODRAFT_217223 [Saitoella complicata NRRL Y-17804]ODQ53794.1 hypothetical protein SAICODRAFT_217223 [Saitoella complicata NRRL Y-17804]GAO47009.1 hypothetical protein G7K_1223-t1 [Saitoella complicata NRRL Y-17804]